MTRVLIAVDENEASIKAAEEASRLFGDHAEYLAVNVTDPSVMAGGERAGWMFGAAYAAPFGAVWPYTPQRGSTEFGGPTDIAPKDVARQRATEAAEEAGLVEAEAIAATGDPADAILHAAELHSVDVIVVGSRDRGWFSRLVNPSVSEDVVKGAEVPVLVVK